MFTIKDAYFILDKTNQDRVFYKNGTFFCYDYDDFSTYEKLDNFYYTDFVCMSKLSYYIRKSFKNCDYDFLKKVIIYLNLIDFCENLKNNTCQIKSISCKLYSCEYLRNKKVYFKIKNIPLLKYFFNLKQKYILKYSFFKPKSYVMYKLMEN